MKKFSKKTLAVLTALVLLISMCSGLAALAAAPDCCAPGAACCVQKTSSDGGCCGNNVVMAGASSDVALTIYTKLGDSGTPTVAKTYTADQLSALKEKGVAGYQYYKNNAWSAVAATEYVRLDALLADAGVTFAAGCSVTATGSDNFAQTATYDTLQTNKYYFKDANTPVEVPAIVALTWGEGSLASGTLDTIAAGATNTGTLRFAYGTTADQYNGKTAAGKRMVNKLASLTVTIPEKTVLTVYTQTGASGTPTAAKSYTASQLNALSQSGTLGYQYYKNNAWNVVAATKYVTLDALLSDAGIAFTSGCSVTATGTDNFAQTATYDTLQTNKYYFKDAKTPVEVPAIVALTWADGSLASATLDTIAAGAKDTGTLRFAYGTTADQYSGNTAAGKRMVSKLASLTVITPVTFTDITAGSWYEKYVTDLVGKGVVTGIGGGLFNPTGTMSYGEALKLIMLAAGYTAQAPTGAHWASGYLTKALADGLLPATVDLDGKITRLEVAQIAAKAMKLSPVTTSTPFPDTSDPYVAALYQAGIVTGTDGVYKPGDNITRAEISAIIWRIQNYKK